MEEQKSEDEMPIGLIELDSVEEKEEDEELDVASMSCASLSAALKERNLPHTANRKNVLAERLTSALKMEALHVCFYQMEPERENESEDMKSRRARHKALKSTKLNYKHNKRISFESYEFFEAHHHNREMYLANGKPNPKACNQGTNTDRRIWGGRSIITYKKNDWYLLRRTKQKTITYTWTRTNKTIFENSTLEKQEELLISRAEYQVTQGLKNLHERGATWKNNLSAITLEKNKVRFRAFLMGKRTKQQIEFRDRVDDYQTTETNTKTENEAAVKLVDSIQTEAAKRNICLGVLEFKQKVKDYLAGTMPLNERKQFLITFRVLKRFLPTDQGGKSGGDSAILCQADLEGTAMDCTDLCIAMMADDVSEGGRTVAHEKNNDGSSLTTGQIKNMLDKTVEARDLRLEERELKRIDLVLEENSNLMDLDAEDADDSDGTSKLAAKRRRSTSTSSSAIEPLVEPSKRRRTSSTSTSSSAIEPSVEPSILILHKHGQEKKLFSRVFEELGGHYSDIFQTVCFGRILWYISGRKMNGGLKDGRGPSLIPMDMSSLTYAICNQEEFLHLADTDTHHQIRVSSAIFRAYAIIHKVVLCQYDL